MRRSVLLVGLVVLFLASMIVGASLPLSDEYDLTWPAAGLAAAILLMVPRRRVWPMAALLASLGSIMHAASQSDPLLQELGVAVGVVAGAVLLRLMLRPGDDDHLEFNDDDRLGILGLATVCAGLVASAVLAVATAVDGDVLTLEELGIVFLGHVASQLCLLPLFVGGTNGGGLGSELELIGQRFMMVAGLLLVLVPEPQPYFLFVLLPLAAWPALRARTRESHLQTLLISIACYVSLLVSPEFVQQVAEPTTTVLILLLFLISLPIIVLPLTVTAQASQSLSSTTHQGNRALNRLVEAVGGIAIILTDDSGRITMFNPGAERIFGYRADQVLGRFPDLFHTSEEIARHAEDLGVQADMVPVSLAMAEKGVTRDWEIVRADGGRRTIALTLAHLTDEAGQTVGYLCTGEDVTQRELTEQALRRALAHEKDAVQILREADQVKSDLVSTISHELRTPVTSIAGYVEVLSDQLMGDLTPAQADVVHRIQRNSQRLRLLIDDLLTLNTIESTGLSLARSELNLCAVVNRVWDSMSGTVSGRDLHLCLDVPPHPLRVMGDGGHLERAVRNLVSNALKFTPDGGTVEVSLRERGEEVELLVADTGIGIPVEDQNRLFTRFYRSTAATEKAIQGTGLGLSIVHAIVTQHGGSIDVDSAPDEGTTMRVRLPLRAAS